MDGSNMFQITTWQDHSSSYQARLAHLQAALIPQLQQFAGLLLDNECLVDVPVEFQIVHFEQAQQVHGRKKQNA
jgi:hypothetical protein